MRQYKLAVVVSHPIQHFCPQYASWARLDKLNLKIIFGSRKGLDSYYDESFNEVIKWNGLNLDFDHSFLSKVSADLVDVSKIRHNLTCELNSYMPDIVVIYGYSGLLPRIATSWAKNNNKLILMISDSESRRYRNALRRLVKKIWLPYVISKYDLLLTVGDANESYYRNYGVIDKKFIRASFPVDIDIFNKMLSCRDDARKAFRTLFCIPDDHLVVLMVGKISATKRQVDLVRASNAMQNNLKNITVIFAGSGPEESDLKSIALNIGVGGVIFAGFVQPEILVNYYAGADLYVHCSEVEAHSLAISEAIYSGLPVVVSDRCGSYGPSDDVQPGLNGFVYPCGDAVSLAKLLCHLSASPELIKQFGRESRLLGIDHQSLAHGKAILQAINIFDLKNVIST